MKLGLFMMPLHDPQRDYTQVLQEDREAILLAAFFGLITGDRIRCGVFNSAAEVDTR